MEYFIFFSNAFNRYWVIFIYKINLSNDSKEFNDIKINTKETYKQVCDLGKRPRLSFQNIKDQIPTFVEEKYKGTVYTLLKPKLIKIILKNK